MVPRHLFSMLVSAILLFAMRSVSAAQPIPSDPDVQDTDQYCPFLVEVGEGQSLSHITLQDRLEFSLKPNMPIMSMKFVGDDVVYKATVDGTMVNLFECNRQEVNCTIVEQGGSKSRDLLVPDKWNVILVIYNNGEITVDVNMRANVMRGHMRMTKGHTKGGGGSSSSSGQVTFVVPPNTPAYQATLSIPCSDGLPKIQTELPIVFPFTPTTTTTTKTPLPESPYEKCPLYKVEVDYPSTPTPLNDNLTLALYPSQSSLQLIVANEGSFFRVQTDEWSVKLLQCQMMRQKCILKDDVRFSIESEKWNVVTVSIQDNKIIIRIQVNEKEGVLTASLDPNYRKGFQVQALAPSGLQNWNYENSFVLFVNIKCEVIEQKMTWPFSQVTSLAPTEKGLPTNAPIVEIPTEAPAPGISRNVSIVVGVLVGALLIIAIAIIISTVVKKRRSAAINEHSQLQNHYQQQD